MTAPSGIITLLTDFGTADAYVGTMKGVILSVDPQARIVDITHEVPPQDIRAAAWHLRTAFRFFPPGTVHVAVVDPGVGGARRAVAAASGGWLFVGPDNGVLTWAARPEDAVFVALAEPRFFLPEVSSTFHGRDVFAPVAAHLAAGTPLDALGPRIDDPVRLPPPELAVDNGAIRAEVVHVDRFGNAITSIDAATLARWSARGAVVVEAGDARIDGISRTYSDAPPGSPLALVGSSGYMEIAVRDGDAARALGLARGARITVRRR